MVTYYVFVYMATGKQMYTAFELQPFIVFQLVTVFLMRAVYNLFANCRYACTVVEDERDRLVEVLEPTAVHRQRRRRAARDRLEHGHVRSGNESVRLRETTHRRNVRRKPGTLPVSLRHTGRNSDVARIL